MSRDTYFNKFLAVPGLRTVRKGSIHFPKAKEYSMYSSKESRDIIRFKKYKIDKNICMTLYEWIFHSINKLKIVFLDVSIKKITFNPPLIPNISRKFSLRISYRIPLFKNRSSSKKKVSSMEITHCSSNENWAMDERRTKILKKSRIARITDPFNSSVSGQFLLAFHVIEYTVYKFRTNQTRRLGRFRKGLLVEV